MAFRARREGYIRGTGNRIGHYLCDVSVRDARTGTADAGAGPREEEAAAVLGANGWQTLWLVTLPNVKSGLLYGVILCNARAMGEFGAVSVVSGHIGGATNTLPLHVEILYNEYQFAAAFACASLLALVTLVIKTVVEVRFENREKEFSK